MHMSECSWVGLFLARVDRRLEINPLFPVVYVGTGTLFGVIQELQEQQEHLMCIYLFIKKDGPFFPKNCQFDFSIYFMNLFSIA